MALLKLGAERSPTRTSDLSDFIAEAEGSALAVTTAAARRAWDDEPCRRAHRDDYHRRDERYRDDYDERDRHRRHRCRL